MAIEELYRQRLGRLGPTLTRRTWGDRPNGHRGVVPTEAWPVGPTLTGRTWGDRANGHRGVVPTEAWPGGPHVKGTDVGGPAKWPSKSWTERGLERKEGGE